MVVWVAAVDMVVVAVAGFSCIFLYFGLLLPVVCSSLFILLLLSLLAISRQGSMVETIGGGIYVMTLILSDDAAASAGGTGIFRFGTDTSSK